MSTELQATVKSQHDAKLPVISCADFQRFIDAIAQKAEYISGKQYKNCYEGLMIPVIEYNEILAAARNVLNIDVS